MAYLIRQMGHVALGVPDPDASATDLARIVGVKRTGVDGETGAVLLSSNTRRYEVSYRPAATPRVLAIGLEAVSAAAVDEIAARARSDGLEILDDRPLLGGVERAVRFRGPARAIFEVHTPVLRSEAARHIGPGSRPKRLEHVNILATDVPAVRDFVSTLLGLKLSDRAGDGLFSWWRAEDGFHHTIAVGPGPDKLHHYAFDLRSMEDLVGIADSLSLDGRPLLWGPGRHGAGENVFTYYVDPDGCVVENSIEMQHVDNDATHEPTSWDISEGAAGRWINLWGTPPPASFGDPGLPFA